MQQANMNNINMEELLLANKLTDAAKWCMYVVCSRVQMKKG